MNRAARGLATKVDISGNKEMYDPDIHHRRSIRLKRYDYSNAGLYFITICTQNRRNLFGQITPPNTGAGTCAWPNDNLRTQLEMQLNSAGKMIETLWYEIPVYYRQFEVHEFIVMPNHVHGIIENLGPIRDAGVAMEKGQPQGVAPTMSLSDIVHRFKTLTTKRYTDGVKQKRWPRYDLRLWQRNYYEHVIRDQASYLKLVEYIETNPMKWHEDKYFCQHC